MGLLFKLKNGETSLKSLRYGHDRPGGGDSGNCIKGGGSSDGGAGWANTGSETYDGTSWSTRPSLGTARHALAGAGTASAALAAGGNVPPWSNATEEFTPESTAANIKDFTTS